MDPEGRGGGEELRGVGGREMPVKINDVRRRNLFSIKRKKGVGEVQLCQL